MTDLDSIQSLAPEARRYERYLLILCCFHDDHNPSLLVYSDGYHCLSCGAHGSLSKLEQQLSRYTGFSRKSEISRNPNFRSPWNRWLAEKSMPEFAWEAHQNLKRWPDQAVYLRERKIAEFIDELQLGWLEGWYFFPVKDKWGDVISLVARVGSGSQDETNVRYITPPHVAPGLYIPNWDIVEKATQIYVVFGIIDAIVLHSLGFAAITGTNGKNIHPDLLQAFRKKITIIPDDKEEPDAYKLAGGLGWRGAVKRVNWPEKCKDVADIFKLFGRQQLLTAIS